MGIMHWFSTSALNNVVVSKYAAQGKRWLGKLAHWYGFAAWRRTA